MPDTVQEADGNLALLRKEKAVRGVWAGKGGLLSGTVSGTSGENTLRALRQRGADNSGGQVRETAS